jgi:trans-aconitate methyltransferase
MPIDQQRQTTPDAGEESDYYYGHAAQVQSRVGVNERHRSILRRLKRSGLRSTHQVLEIGCGIGTLTSLLVKSVPEGHVHAVDISPAAVDMARRALVKHQNLEFGVSDMTDFVSTRRFDRIVLPDVLEHIPEEQHAELFTILADHLAPQGRICIHIPDPEALDHLRRTDPAQLQIIDQSLAILPMTQRFAAQGLVLDRYERYSIWATDPDYVWIEFRRPDPQATRSPRPYWERALRGLLSRFM